MFLKIERVKTNETLINQQINLCQLVKYNGIIREKLKQEMKRMDFETKCPAKPGWYRFNETEYQKDKLLTAMRPAWFNIDEDLRMTFILKTRVKKDFDFIFAEEMVKSLEELF